ncbi:MAG TPA: hypothetical protein VFA18_20690 [Gemmataceae bacterium]|nr:hypothetical protein [Gemmataceae bacterium]
MSIVRVGLSETQKFAEGYDAIFGKKNPTRVKKKTTGTKSSAGRKKKKKST